MSAAPTFHMPCGFTPRECNVEAAGRVHDAEDKGLASAYVCEDHIEWGHSWVHSKVGEPGSIFAEFPQEDA